MSIWQTTLAVAFAAGVVASPAVPRAGQHEGSGTHETHMQGTQERGDTQEKKEAPGTTQAEGKKNGDMDKGKAEGSQGGMKEGSH